MEKKNKVVLGVMLIAVMLIGSALAVAYFLTGVSNSNKEVLEVNTGSLSLIFDDNNDGMQIKSLTIGESVSKEVKIENNGTLPVTTNLNWKNLTNTYLTKSLSYKLEYKTTEDGEWALVETVVGSNVPRSLEESEITMAKDLTIPNGKTYYYKLTITLENLDNVNQGGEINSYLGTKFCLGELKENSTFNVPDAVASMLSNEIPVGINATAPDFAVPATTDEGIFSMEDDYGTSYYYRGAVKNNYVKFGGFYWRIIRINGDGSLRMIYDGTSYHANGESNADRYTKTGQPFNARSTDVKYAGYMYGGTSKYAVSTSAKDAQTNKYDSDIKTVVDIWYENNIELNVANSNGDLSKYLADSIFCNDRTLPAKGETWSITYQDATYANLGWGTHVTPYGAYSRFKTANNKSNPNPVPTFKCRDNLTTGNANNDRFTVDDIELGNGALKYPAGLITADEIIAAGSGRYATPNNSYYLYKGTNSKIWSLSPDCFSGSDVVFPVYNGNHLDYFVVNNSGTVVPVINLKSEYAIQLIGTGVQNDEYRLEGVN